MLGPSEVAMSQPILSVPEFYAHALAIERDAAARYAEMEQWLRRHGAPDCADLCAILQRAEADHFAQLREVSAGLPIPELPAGTYKWLGATSPEGIPRERFEGAVSVRAILELALQGECEAAKFFDHVARTSPDFNVRMLARDMAGEEAEHARWIGHAIESPEAMLFR